MLGYEHYGMMALALFSCLHYWLWTNPRYCSGSFTIICKSSLIIWQTELVENETGLQTCVIPLL